MDYFIQIQQDTHSSEAHMEYLPIYIDHIQNHQTHINKFKIIKDIQRQLSGNNRIKLGINN